MPGMRSGLGWPGVFFSLERIVNDRYHDREDASSMVTAGATANTIERNSRASRESGLVCSHSHGESIAARL